MPTASLQTIIAAMSNLGTTNGSLSLGETDLGIVCPMANEEASVVRFVNSVLRECRAGGFKSVTFYAILDLVSTDKTLDLLKGLKEREPQLRIVYSPENKTVVDAYVRGYSEALRAGHDWILEIDAGFSHEPTEIPRFFDKMLGGYDCVFGSRYVAGGKVTGNSLSREIVSHGGSVLVNIMLGTRLKDMTGGFEMFSHAALSEILNKGIHSRSPFFQTEIKVYCREMKIVEIPIHYRADGNNFNYQTLVDAFNNLWRLFRLRLQGQL